MKKYKKLVKCMWYSYAELPHQILKDRWALKENMKTVKQIN